MSEHFSVSRSELVSVKHYASIADAIAYEQSNDAVHFIFESTLRQKALQFLSGFRGKTLYAVKANPHEKVLRTLWNAGIQAFDVASLREVEHVLSILPDAHLYFMHPVKSRVALRASYKMGVRAFAFDHRAELAKIMEETDHAQDLCLFLRVAAETTGAAYRLDGKFGASATEVVELLKMARPLSKKLGLCFHVGSQCMRPAAYQEAIAIVAGIAHQAGVKLDAIDAGGGFPAPYPSMEPPPLSDYFQAIHEAIDSAGLGNVDIFCEPGRAMVAEAGAMATRIELRKEAVLYLNDGAYGALFDAATHHWPFPVSLVTGDGRVPSSKKIPFHCFGPTCDSFDELKGSILLPSDATEGDWVVFENIGAYGQAMQSSFNGFFSHTTAMVEVGAGGQEYRLAHPRVTNCGFHV